MKHGKQFIKDEMRKIFAGIPEACDNTEIIAQRYNAVIIKVKNKNYDILKPLKIYLNNHLTRFKIPRYYIFVEKFPMTGTGKIDLAQLKTFAKDYVSNQKD